MAAVQPQDQLLNLDKLLEYHHHEDNLLNARLNALLVSTAFLVLAFAQFRDRPYFLMAMAICIIGLVIAIVFVGVLGRAANGLRWSNDEIRKAEARADETRQIYPESCVIDAVRALL